MKKRGKEITIVFFMLIFLISTISACTGEDCIDGKTLIKGKIYEEATGKKIKDAVVEATCNGITYQGTSNSAGKYYIYFSKDECKYGDDVLVNANLNGLTGTEQGKVSKESCELDIGIINVPMVPEFGFFIGTLTLFSAVGIFFLIRRK